MGHKLGIGGVPNSGKSFSRRTIKDGENVIILAPSNKATHLKTTEGVPLKPFDIRTSSFANSEQACAALGAKHGVNSIHSLLKYWTDVLPEGTFTPENITGNIQVIEKLEHLPIWTEFVSKHLPWVHTIIIPDFTHFISRVISTDEFIQRKAGGEAYQRFWELAGSALRHFIISIDKLRHNLLVVTEFHAEHNEALDNFDIFVPAGKMMTEKFKVPSYYDILLFTDVKMPEEDDGEPQYRFVTKPTRRYPYARAMNLFPQTYIDNDLQAVIDKVRDYLGIPWTKWQAPEKKKTPKKEEVVA